MPNQYAVYPGSFDPVTNGHLDLIKRGLTIFDRIVVAIVTNPSKTPLFSLQERIDMLKEATETIDGNIEIDAFNGMLIHYMEKKGIHVVLRGLRAVSDFDYEFEMALVNRRMDKTIETIFMAPNEKYIYLRARLVKEIAKQGGDVTDFVPYCVERRLLERCSEQSVIV